ncbi:flagellar motor switch protein FliN [Aquidulcibacter sp.]|uniref:flagellar motor switch protein FliN n=1 Tax=Aquidulcibacter sp. TaxID=2052990 RepID=UPI0025BC7D0B|nr:flagellar motor switch protein FliN [Aquidulcibacter sp.]MCA3698121.1 flagellar motor switch protein FliN [Aquidulcibacter sp.]
MDENNESYDLPDLSELDPLPAEAAQAEVPQQYTRSATDLAPVFDVPVNIKAVLGRATMDVASLLKLARGSLIELDRRVGEAIDIYVNNRLVARGELVVVDERLGVTMTEIIKDNDTNS